MTKILLVTVGGSFQPIVTSIHSLKPDRVIFICSDGDKGSKSQVIGEGTPCEVRRGTEVIEKLPNIPTQVKLGDRFHPQCDLILIQNPDNLSECYHLISSCIRHLQQQTTHDEIIADYTGGTKTMSAALVLAAADCGISLYITMASTRENLVRVERGEVTQKVDTSFRSLRAHRKANVQTLEEAQLLHKINQDIDPELRAQYQTLRAKLEAETLTDAEYNTLIQLSNQIEQFSAQCLEALANLAQLRQVSLSELMETLGIQ